MRALWQVALATALAGAVAMAAGAQDALVVVNGEGITREALVTRLLDLTTIGQAQLEEMINEALLFQAARKQGITVTDAEIDARIAQVKQQVNTDEAFNRYLASQGVTAKGLREKLRVKMLVEKMLADKVKVTDEDVRKAYDINKPAFEAPESLTLRMILVKTKERAADAIKRLGAGESFADVAKALSENKYTADRGGLLGRVSRENLSPALAEAAFATEVGKYTQPIDTPDGFYILKVEARNAAASQSFDEVKQAIRERLQEGKLQEAWLDWLQQARAQASIEQKWKH